MLNRQTAMDPRFTRSIQEKPKEKTGFDVKLELESFDAAAKPKSIREVKALVPNLTLIETSTYCSLPSSGSNMHTSQAEKLVESLSEALRENLPKEDFEAEKPRATFEGRRLRGGVKLE